MNWIKKNWLPLIAIVLSVTAWFQYESIVVADSSLVWLIGITTALLSVAITVIIAFQVYNSIIAESKIKRIISDQIEQSEKDINKKSEENRQEFLALLYIAQSQRSFIEKEYETTLDILMRALVHAKECTSKIAYNTTIEALRLLIQAISKECKEFSVEMPAQLWYKDVTTKINDKSITEVERFINELKTRMPELSDEIKKILDPLRKE